MSESRKNLFNLLSELSEEQEIVDKNYITDAETFWNSLTKEQQMQCFYFVIRTITDSELKDNFDSYRKILYDQFGFPTESYYIGMLAGFMELHNSILRPSEMKEYRKLIYEKRLKNETNSD